MKPIPFQPFIDPVVYRSDEEARQAASGGRLTTLAALCTQAGIPLRATTPARVLYVVSGPRQIRSLKLDVVGVPTSDLASKETALRALEALAFSFHDHAARTCVCGRGLFVAPEVLDLDVLLGQPKKAGSRMKTSSVQEGYLYQGADGTWRRAAVVHRSPHSPNNGVVEYSPFSGPGGRDTLEEGEPFLRAPLTVFAAWAVERRRV